MDALEIRTARASHDVTVRLAMIADGKGWCFPTVDAMPLVAEHLRGLGGRGVSIGAGTGFVERALNVYQGVEITMTDSMQWFSEPLPFCGTLDGADDAAKYCNEVDFVLFIYPPEGESMAFDALKAVEQPGSPFKHVVVMGEIGKSCGDSQFWGELDQKHEIDEEFRQSKGANTVWGCQDGEPWEYSDMVAIYHRRE